MRLSLLTCLFGAAVLATQACSSDPSPTAPAPTTASSASTTGSTGGGAAAGGAGGSGGAGTAASGTGGCISGTGGGMVRIATWNVEGVGAPGTTEHDAALAVLDRVNADVVGINEVNGEADAGHLDALAFDAGYDESFGAGSPSPFGTPRNAVMSRLTITDKTLHTAATLSGDGVANDLTRLIPAIVVNVNGCPLTVVVDHWKSGAATTDVFRRSVESFRVRQIVASLDAATEPFVIVGDLNEELDEVPVVPSPFTSVPSGMPPEFSLGADLQAVLSSDGLVDDAFTALLGIPGGVLAVDALQLDGSDATRPDSGRRLDYLFVSAALTVTGAEVYDSADESLGPGRPKAGGPLQPVTSQAAADHLLVFADVEVPGCSCMP